MRALLAIIAIIVMLPLVIVLGVRAAILNARRERAQDAFQVSVTTGWAKKLPLVWDGPALPDAQIKRLETIESLCRTQRARMDALWTVILRLSDPPRPDTAKYPAPTDEDALHRPGLYWFLPKHVVMDATWGGETAAEPRIEFAAHWTVVKVYFCPAANGGGIDPGGARFSMLDMDRTEWVRDTVGAWGPRVKPFWRKKP